MTMPISIGVEGNRGLGRNLGGLQKPHLPWSSSNLPPVETLGRPQSAGAQTGGEDGHPVRTPGSPDSPLHVILSYEEEIEEAPRGQEQPQVMRISEAGSEGDARPASSAASTSEELAVAIKNRSRYTSWYEFMNLLRNGKVGKLCPIRQL